MSKQVVEHQDNVLSHTPAIVKDAIAEVGFELVEHPPYSPDLASSNYRLFQKFKEHMHRKKISWYDVVNHWFAEVEQSFFQMALEMFEY